MLTEDRFNTFSGSKRMPELDALRGLAALAVIFFHFSLSIPSGDKSIWELLLFQAGAERVTFFFVLSGFVLILSMINRQNTTSYKSYYVRRFMRIYPLYIVATVATYLIKIALLKGAVSLDYVTTFYNISWRIPVSFTEMLNTLTLIGNYDTWALIGPAWTLMFEMRISILLPLIMLAFNRFPKISLTVIILAGGIAALYDSLIPVIDGFYSTNLDLSNTLGNLTFGAIFGVGMLLAYNREKVFNKYRNLSHSKRIAWFLAGFAMYMNAVWLPHFFGAISGYVHQLITSAGVVLIMVFCVNNLITSKILRHKTFQFFGKTSYGLYLWHFPLFYIFVALLQPYMGIEYVCLITFAVTILLSWLTYKYIEVPFIEIGRKISSKIDANARKDS